jgi:heptosyltransferase III
MGPFYKNGSMKPRRILAVRGGALGDFILTLPALRALRGTGQELELLTHSAFGRLALDFGFVSGWRSLTAREAALLMVPGAAVDEDWREWLAGFDRVVSWMPDPDGAFQQQIRRCGVADFHQADWRCAESWPAARQLATAAGASILTSPLLFPDRPLPAKSPCIAFHPGSGSPRKNWPLERWIKILRHIQELHPGVVWLVVTGEVEAEGLRGIHAALDESGVGWAPAHGLDLTALAHRLRECRAFLGHDSGVSHLAAACGVPCGLLFGPTDPAVWAPMGEDVRVLRAGLGELTVEAVLAWLLDLIDFGAADGTGCGHERDDNRQRPIEDQR